ncbi:MAG: ABC transporter substrate-binding protein [Desulfobacterales bacterium]|nr:ABC transporter substrate-binding protein [Desulfobacterales bacterium]
MKNSPQRIIHFVWLPALVVLLSACSSSEDPHNQPAAAPSENVLRIDVDYNFGPFCPHTLEFSGSRYVFPFIYSFLFVPNPDGGLQPDLAAHWAYAQKTFTWRIELRKDARFHNGVPVTAADAVYSILTLTKNLQKGLAQKIRSVKAVDGYVLEIQIEQDDPSFLTSIWDVEIIPDFGRHANLNLDDFPVGSGPFKFAERKDDGRVILTVNENYYNGRPAIDQVVFYYIPQREESWVRLINGETDIVGDLAIKDYQIIEKYADRFYFSKSTYHYYSILLYNIRHQLFANPLVRRALTHAIDRDYIVQKMLNGFAEVVAGPMGNQSPFHDPDLKPLDYDPALAQELLAKAGWTLDPQSHYLVKNGQFFEFEMLLPSGDETGLRVARYIQLCLNDVGIRTHLKTLPLDVLNERHYQNTEFDAVLTELTANPRRPEEILGLWVKLDDIPSKAGGFDSPKATRLAGMILAANNPDTKKSLFREFDRLIDDLQPGSFLFQKIYIDAMSRRFTLNYPFSFSLYGFNWLQSARLRNE